MELTNGLIASALWVDEIFKQKVSFCGSFGLFLSGQLGRLPHDIDCITDECFYGVYPWGNYLPSIKYDEEFDSLTEAHNLYAGGSNKFFVNDVEVKSFKLVSPYGIDVDVMYRPDKTESKKIFLHDRELNVQLPVYAFEAKSKYLSIVASRKIKTEINSNSIIKHQADLEYLETIKIKSK